MGTGAVSVLWPVLIFLVPHRHLNYQRLVSQKQLTFFPHNRCIATASQTPVNTPILGGGKCHSSNANNSNTTFEIYSLCRMLSCTVKYTARVEVCSRASDHHHQFATRKSQSMLPGRSMDAWSWNATLCLYGFSATRHHCFFFHT